jgi:glycosyltransferase involved in cell wall biosynthesis
MHRICTTLAGAGYTVTLIGRQFKTSKPLEPALFQQVRLHCLFTKGMVFYAEYNLRLFIWLLFGAYDAICTVDLDTMPAGCLAGLILRKKRVYDAHEYFTEVPELVGRPLVRSIWHVVAKICIPAYKRAYTVGPALADLMEKAYGLSFAVVRNVPVMKKPADSNVAKSDPPVLLYQGALNDGRGIEAMLEAMQQLNGVELWLAGEGDLSADLREMAHQMGVSHKVRFLGYLAPRELAAVTGQAWLGLNLLENKGLSYYYSLANKFFDCVQAGVPLLTMDFPEYRALNQQYEVAVLLGDINPGTIVRAVISLQANQNQYELLAAHCREAANAWNWEQEKPVLLEVWRQVMG